MNEANFVLSNDDFHESLFLFYYLIPTGKFSWWNELHLVCLKIWFHTLFSFDIFDNFKSLFLGILMRRVSLFTLCKKSLIFSVLWANINCKWRKREMKIPIFDASSSVQLCAWLDADDANSEKVKLLLNLINYKADIDCDRAFSISFCQSCFALTHAHHMSQTDFFH